MRWCVMGVLALGFSGASVHAGDWPGWRGPTGQGHTNETGLPLTWSPTENVRWKVPLPAEGNSTPVIWGDRIFLTQALGKGAGSWRMLWCLRRADGQKLWERGVVYPYPEPTHATNPFCSASPATDGERVVVSFGSAGLYAYDFAGKELWKKDVGKLEHIWGNASSPVLYGDLAILWGGPGERQFLLAVNKRTGAEVWRHDEPGGISGLGADKSWVGSWSTPIVARVNGQDQLILSVPEKVKGFDPQTGAELWSCAGLGKLVYTSPLYADGIVVAMSGYSGPALAVRLGGRGDIARDRLWHHTEKNPQRIGSGVVVGEHLYILEENGTPHCFELRTGKELWGKQDVQRLGGGWGSMVAAGERLYVVGRKADTYVLAARPEYRLLATNRLGEDTNASLAVSNGELFLRTYQHLWCIAAK
jgi:outer membrane protein assembly factor BamB